MPIVEWDDRFLTGVEQFDTHHKHLVSLLNLASDGYLGGASIDLCAVLMDELFDYASYHFVAEEFWMSQQQFPDIEQHIEEHNRFVKRLQEICDDVKSHKPKTCLEILEFLREWFLNHILVSDGAYSTFVSAHEATVSQDDN